MSAYEIWNEPNSIQFSNPIDPVAYAQLLEAVYPIIKAADPTATVVAGAVGAAQDSPFTMSPVEFVQKMLAAGAGGSFDALSVHPYSDQIPFSGTCPTCAPGILTPQQQVQAIMALINPDQKVWISEYGVSTQPGGADYQTEATWIKDLLDTWQSYSQAGPVFLYTGQDTATGSSDPTANLGIWTDTGGEKTYTVNGVTYSVSEMLAAWIAAHPQTTGPTGPGYPSSNPIADFVNNLVQRVQAFVHAIVTAITNFFGGLGGAAAAPAAQMMALRVASVESPATASLAAASAAAASTDGATAGDGKGTGATAAGATTPATGTDKTSAAEAPADVTKTPAEPVAATETTAPATTETTGTTGTTGAAGTTGTTSGATTSTAVSTDGNSGESGDTGKSGDSGKSGASHGHAKSVKDTDHKDGSRHARGRNGDSDAKPEGVKHDAAKAAAKAHPVRPAVPQAR